MADINNLFNGIDIGAVVTNTAKPKKVKTHKIELDDDINLTVSEDQLFAGMLEEDEIKTKSVKPSTKANIQRINNIKQAEVDAEKVLKSKNISVKDRLAVINAHVLKVLGKQRNNVLVIRDKQTFEDYISKAISVGRIAVDTETNNSLDPVTCKLMGLCLYIPGEKQAYIPINHRNPDTKELLANQLTETDCKEQLQRIIDNKVMVVMHNGKFDYEVIKCTCGIAVKPDWDTMVCARLLNENERAGLKEQYTSKIDPSQARYDIESLFENINYADVDPDIFALYAATDSLMTDKLYEFQKVELDKEEYGPHMDLLGTHEVKGLRWLFHEVEMPIVVVTAEMELTGVTVDEEYGARLKEKYDKQLADVDTEIETILTNLAPVINTWKCSTEADTPSKIYASKKSKMTKEKLEAMYPNEDKTGRYKLGKKPKDLLEDPINLSSPTQLAVLFYNILGVKNEAKDGSRKTGKDELKTIKEKLANYAYNKKYEEFVPEASDEDLDDDIEEAEEKSNDLDTILKLGSAAKLADLLLTRRKIAKLVTTYIDVIPELAKHWPDGRIRFHMNSLGTDTGRYSSGGKLKFMENDQPIVVSGINIQNIPSHNPEVRMLFKAAIKNHQVELTDNYYEVPETDEVETISGWKKVKELVVGDTIVGENNQDIIRNIEKRQDIYYVYVV